MSDNDELDEMSEDKRNIIDSALLAGIKMAEIQEIPREIDQEETSVLVPVGFEIHTLNNHMKRPLRKTGIRSFESTKSFCSYVNKHKSEDETIIVAHEDSGRIKAILNDDGATEPSWSDFGALLALGFSNQWLTWFKNSYPKRESFFGQEEFANFIEDNRSDLKVGTFKDNDGKDVKNLSALELTAVITNLDITYEENITSKVNLSTGETTLHYENNEVGQGSFAIPKRLFLAIPIYKSGDLFQVDLRLRTKKSGSSLVFYFIIDQVDLLKEGAFDMICQRITDGNMGSEEKADKQFSGTGIEVLKGTL